MGDAARSTPLPSFERPPVVEVAVGVHFLQLQGFNSVALVRLADKWRGLYPKTQEQPALPPEAPAGQGGVFTIQLQNSLPPIRLWLLSDDESFLVQIQHDRLLLNWRKVQDNDPYPRYGKLRQDFSQLWSEFVQYIVDGDYGVLQPMLAEVTFFNRIPISGAADVPKFIASLNSQWTLEDHLATGLQFQRAIAGAASQHRGHQKIALAYQPELSFLQLETSSLVMTDAEATDSAAIFSALDEAHDAGVLTFDHTTTDSAHTQWGKHDVSTDR